MPNEKGQTGPVGSMAGSASGGPEIWNVVAWGDVRECRSVSSVMEEVREAVELGCRTISIERQGAPNNRNLPRDRVGSRELVSLLSEWERVAFGHESVFLERFCHDAWQLVGAYWCSEKMEVVYVLDSGQHVTDSIPLNEWLEFYEANN